MKLSGSGAFSVHERTTPAIESTVAVKPATFEGGSVLPTVVLEAIAGVGDCSFAPFNANILNL